MEGIKFVKYHALGNDYLVLNPSNQSPLFSPKDIERVCHRNLGLGSDGILYGPLDSSIADFRLEIWNPDGSEAEKSGNGLRIFSRYLFDEKLVQSSSIFTVETLGGIAKCIVNDKEDTITVDLGTISFDCSKIPVLLQGESREVLNEEMTIGEYTIQYYSATIGNPHVIILRDNPTKEETCRLGPLIENNTKLFPNKTNVQFLKVIDRNNIQIEIWERGAGYTLASGSSSSATAAVAHKIGACDDNITVHCPGGNIQIKVNPGYEITMTAGVTRVGVYYMEKTIFDF